MDLRRHRSVLLKHLDLQNLPQSRAIRRGPTRTSQRLALGRLSHDNAHVAPLWRNDSRGDGVRAIAQKNRFDSVNALRNHHILLDAEIVLGHGTFAITYNRQLLRAESQFVACQLRRKSGIPKLNTPSRQWRLR